MALGTYSPLDIVMTLNDYKLSDFAEGTFIEVTQNSYNFKPVRGIRGKHTRVRNRDRSGTITFRLSQTSPQNDILSKLAYQDDINQSALLFVVLRDVGGLEGVQAVNAYLEGYPNLTYKGDTTTPREWRIHYETFARYQLGGGSQGLFDFLGDIVT